MSKSRLRKPASVEEYQLEMRFAQLQSDLADEKYADLRHRQLAHWALPNDRGLPMAFLGRSLDDLLDSEFAELLGTAGIGYRKMASLIMLLQRAANGQFPEEATEPAAEAPRQNGAAAAKVHAEPNAELSNVSEAHWQLWCRTVKENGLQHEPLGRLAPSLQRLPTVIWNKPLNAYSEQTLAEIRRMRTHGEKRVRAILEVFSTVHRALGGAAGQDALKACLAPRNIAGIQRWISQVMSGWDPPQAEIKNHLAEPLIEQIRIDLGDAVAELAANRLGLNGPQLSVRRQAKELELTRARVYQLLEDCSKVMRVRWPEGEWMLSVAYDRLCKSATESEALALWEAISALFFQRPSQPLASPLSANPLAAEPVMTA